MSGTGPITPDGSTRLALQTPVSPRSPGMRIPPTGSLTIAARLAAALVRIPTPPPAARIPLPRRPNR